MFYHSLLFNSPTVLKFGYNSIFIIYSVEHIKLKLGAFTSKENLKMKSIIDYPDKSTFNIKSAKKCKLEMCPSEHVSPASQHPLERDATIIKNNNVRRVFFSESTTFLYYRPLKNMANQV